MKRRNRKAEGSVLILALGLICTIALLVACAGGAAEPEAAATTEPAAEVEEPAEEEAAPAEEEAAPAEEEPPAEGEEGALEGEETAEGENLNRNFSPGIPEPEEPVVVTFASWVYAEGWQSLADQFHEIHPNITIEFVDVPFENMHDTLLTQVAANNPPDTAYVDASIVGEFSSRGALVNLDEYIAQSEAIDLNDYVPAFVQSAQWEGSMYGLPIDGESTGLFYRTDCFEEAGLDPNHPPATWEEFREYAEVLTDPENNRYGFIAFAPEAAYYFYPWLWQAGGDTLASPTDVVWDSPEGQRAADFYVDLAQFAPPDFLNSNSWDGRVAFANGDVCMYVAGAWFAGTLLTEFPDATGLWAAAPLPQDERCATTIAGDHLVIFEDSENPEAAFKWIEFVSAPHNMAVLNLGTPENPATLLPPRISLLEDPTTFEGRPFLQGFADNMQCAVVSEVIQPRYGEAEQFLNDYLGRAFYGEMDGATAVVESAAEAETLLSEE
jgi:ABC-type glycerol-3-phosphate transport system substrate-binding protein